FTIADLTKNVGALPRKFELRLGIGLQQGSYGRGVERTRAGGRRRLRRRERQDARGPFARLFRQAPKSPVHLQRGDQPKSNIARYQTVATPGEDGAQIVILVRQSVEPARLVRTVQLALCSFRQCEEEDRYPRSRRLLLATSLQPVETILAHC